jgi:hypothetical protein
MPNNHQLSARAFDMKNIHLDNHRLRHTSIAVLIITPLSCILLASAAVLNQPRRLDIISLTVRSQAGPAVIEVVGILPLCMQLESPITEQGGAAIEITIPIQSDPTARSYLGASHNWPIPPPICASVSRFLASGGVPIVTSVQLPHPLASGHYTLKVNNYSTLLEVK